MNGGQVIVGRLPQLLLALIVVLFDCWLVVFLFL